MLVRMVRTVVVLMLAFSTISCVANPVAPAALSAAPAAPAALSVAPAAPDTSAVALPATSLTPSAGATPAPTHTIFSQTPRAAGGVLLSSLRYLEQEKTTNAWVWESFLFDSMQVVTEVRWRGAYDPNRRGSGGPARDFLIEVYASIPNGSEPDVASGPLVSYKAEGNAGETPAAKLGGAQTYDYSFTFPVPFEAAPWTPYWIQIEAYQAGVPDWGLVKADGGDAQHFRKLQGDGLNQFQLAAGDPAVELVALDSGAGAAVLWERTIQLKELPPAEVVKVNSEGVQEVVLVISNTGYTPTHFSVKAGVPARVIFRQLGYVPGGNILLIRWGKQQLKYLTLETMTDKEIVEFTPQEPGDFVFNCPHYWYEGVMTVRP